MSTKRAGFDQQIIRDLADILNDTNLTEIEVEFGDLKVRVSRQSPAVHAYAPAIAAPAAAPATAGPQPAASAPSAPQAGAAAADSSRNAVPSPMVGTAYAAPEPGSSPFVRVGDTVKAGQTLLIIEAMKVMNPIKAPRGGTVTEIMISDGQPVEFGEVLMVIE